jgi:hypothetical protein
MTAYDLDVQADYPNLAGKVNSTHLSPQIKRIRFLLAYLHTSIEDKLVKNVRSVAVVAVVGIILASGFAQKAVQHLLSSEELQKIVPTDFFFAGQKAPTQLRNSAGFQTADGKVTFGALVDASGYSTAVQQKYQGLLITESKLSVGGSKLAAGQYGFGFAADKFVVMNVANEDVLSVAFQTDSELKRPVPLKLIEDGAGYKLYAGRKWVAVKPE